MLTNFLKAYIILNLGLFSTDNEGNCHLPPPSAVPETTFEQCLKIICCINNIQNQPQNTVICQQVKNPNSFAEEKSVLPDNKVQEIAAQNESDAKQEDTVEAIEVSQEKIFDEVPANGQEDLNGLADGLHIDKEEMPIAKEKKGKRAKPDKNRAATPRTRQHGLMRYRKWWELNEAEILVGGKIVVGTPIFVKNNTLRVVNADSSYFIPLDRVDYIRTDDGLESGFEFSSR